MKSLFICMLLAFTCFLTFAQAPEGFNYQGVARDNSGKELLNKSIGLRFSILSNSATGTVVYNESHTTATNNFGLFTVKIGTGTLLSGNFSNINWSNNKYFLKVEMDPAGGSSYSFLGSSQLISVPYALMANKSLKSLNDLDTSAINELQILKLNSDTLQLDRGGYVYLGKYDDKNAILIIKNKLNSDSAYLDTKINSEKTDRQNFDDNLVLKIKSDSVYLKGLYITNSMSISNEANARIAGDKNLNTKIISDSTYLKGLITTEVSNRTAADNSIRTKISSDSSSFRAIINTTNSNLTNETNSRISSDLNIKAKQSSDSSYLKGLINNKQNTLTAGSGIIINSSTIIKAIDTSSTNELQSMSIRNDTIFLSNGGFVKLPVGISSGSNPGDMQYWNGSKWVPVAAGQPGQYLQFTTSNKPAWTGAAYPTVTTSSLSAIAINSLTTGGNVTSDGGGTVTARGVCWSTNKNPTPTNNKTVDGTGTGSFVSYVTSLSPNSKYYIRAYATNSAGTVYGNTDSCTTNNFIMDIDNNGYDTVKIGTQTWMKQNLKTSRYNDGITISLVTVAATWTGLTTAARCYYNNDSVSFKETYGALYNGYVNMAKLCPTGWHVPTDAEWSTLETFVGGASVAGGNLKEAGFSHWLSPNTGATNSSGFTALAAGNRFSTGIYNYISIEGAWWTSTTYNTTNTYYRMMDYSIANTVRSYTLKTGGLSVRCLKN